MTTRDGSCPTGKTGYASRDAARQGAVAVARRNGDRRMPVFMCEHCKRWHLTSKIGRSM